MSVRWLQSREIGGPGVTTGIKKAPVRWGAEKRGAEERYYSYSPFSFSSIWSFFSPKLVIMKSATGAEISPQASAPTCGIGQYAPASFLLRSFDYFDLRCRADTVNFPLG